MAVYLNKMASFIVLIVFFAGLAYVGLGIAAYSHILDEGSKDKILAASPSWALNTSIYDNAGKKLCRYGKLLIFIDVVGVVIWLTLR